MSYMMSLLRILNFILGLILLGYFVAIAFFNYNPGKLAVGLMCLALALATIKDFICDMDCGYTK